MIGLLFAGQGSQAVGMGYDLYNKYDCVKKVYDLYPEIRDVCFNGPKEKLNDTLYAQPCIALTSIAISELIVKYGIKPEFVAGLSLGEYSALAFANAISLEDVIPIIKKRGQIMKDSLPVGKSGMAAILNADKQVVISACEEAKAEVANYNCPGQIVITGYNDNIDKAIDILIEKGIRRCIKLNVSGAFHSSLLEEASNKLGNVLKDYSFKNPTIKTVYNVYGTESNEDLKEILKKQIKSSVYFHDTILYMIEKGVNTFIEIGPGNVLSGFVRKTNKDIKTYSINTSIDIENMIKEIGIDG